MRGLKQGIQEATDTLSKLVEALYQKIDELPDNPRIKRLASNCFVVRSGDLGNNWSPGHHDFKHQYEAIIQTLRQSKSTDVIAKLQSIITERRVCTGGDKFTKNYLTLHPDVIAHLQFLLV